MLFLSKNVRNVSKDNIKAFGDLKGTKPDLKILWGTDSSIQPTSMNLTMPTVPHTE
jgi:hypothetical protein